MAYSRSAPEMFILLHGAASITGSSSCEICIVPAGDKIDDMESTDGT